MKPGDLAAWDSQIMPADAPLHGANNPKMARKVLSVLKNRPELKAELAQKHPELYGSEGK